MSSREKRESDYPVQLESQFIIRLPQKPAKVLSELIKSGENFKNRLKIQIQDDLRHGELRFDHWLLHTKIVDLPTIVESWKTIDSKSLYKSADICQIMICKEELDDTTEDEASSKNKKKDPLKVDKKYLWPHGITPPTKNIRRRRFRKTLRKKCAESPEIEKEVKRLLRADNEAVSFMWEVIAEEDEQLHKNGSTQSFSQKETKDTNKNITVSNHTSKVEDIFGGALSDSDIEDENVNVDPKEGTPNLCQESLSKTNSIDGLEPIKSGNLVGDIRPDMSEFDKKKALLTKSNMILINKSSVSYKSDNIRQQSTLSSNSNLDLLLQGYVTELEELRRRRQRTQLEISSLENMTLRKRFQDILKTINKEIIMKEMEYHNLKLHIK